MGESGNFALGKSFKPFATLESPPPLKTQIFALLMDSQVDFEFARRFSSFKLSP